MRTIIHASLPGEKISCRSTHYIFQPTGLIFIMLVFCTLVSCERYAWWERWKAEGTQIFPGAKMPTLLFQERSKIFRLNGDFATRPLTPNAMPSYSAFPSRRCLNTQKRIQTWLQSICNKEFYYESTLSHWYYISELIRRHSSLHNTHDKNIKLRDTHRDNILLWLITIWYCQHGFCPSLYIDRITISLCQFIILSAKMPPGHQITLPAITIIY